MVLEEKGLRYNFEWDPTKAKENLDKHKVGFERAATVFLDPRAISIFDQQHSSEEERWLTLGIDQNGVLLVVCHTYREVDPSSCQIRLISARKGTKKEMRQYGESDS